MADSILRLRVDSAEYNNKLKQAVNGLLHMEAECRKVGGTLGVLEKDQLEYVKSLGQMETSCKTARGSLRELSNAYLNFYQIYKRMSDEEKREEGGKALANSLAQLKDRIIDAKMQLKEAEVALGNGAMRGGDFSSILGQLGQKLGINSDLMGLVTTGTLGYTAAITAATTATIAATKAWSDYNAELSKQTNAAMVTTGLKGDDLNKLVDSAKAVSDIYGVDFREVVSSANTLMTQFGKTGDEAMQLIRDGMQGMIQGDGGKLLSMIQQYAPSFRDAGIEASQLVAIIQNSEGGIFTDQNMNAIVMGIRNIRLMTKQTSDALAQLGIDGQDMSRKMNDGSMSVFEALKQVSDALSNVESGSQEAGQVMQAVFGRQGTMAGTKLGEAIASLNTNLEETKTQTGAVGESLANVEMATERLNKSLRDTFGYDGWEQMANGIKGAFVGALAEAITATNDLRNAIFEVSGIDVFSAMISGAADALGPLGQILDRLRQIAGIGQLIKDGGISGATSGVGAGVGSLIGGNSGDNNTSVTETESEKALKAEIERLKKALADAKKPKGGATTPKQEQWAPIQMQPISPIDIFSRSVADVQKDLQVAQKAYNDAGDEMGRAAAKAMIERFQKELDAMKNEGDVTKGGFADAYSYNFQRDIDLMNKDLKEYDKSEGSGFVEQEKIEKLVSGISQIAGGLKQVGVDIPEEIERIISVIQGAMAVVEGVQAVAEVLGMTQMTANTIALGANTAALAALTTAVSANTVTNFIPFARGGIIPHAATGFVVPGNDFSDRTPVLASSGEIILNKAQQGNLASQLTGDSQVAQVGTPYVEGEKVYLGINNSLKKNGKGELVTTSMLRQKGLW